MTAAAPAVKEKPHVSPSSLEMAFKCGEAYRRRYIEKEIIPPGFALLKGGSVDTAATENFKAKIETKEDMKPKDFTDLAAASFEGKIKAEGLLLTAEEEAVGKDIVTGAAKDSTVRMAGEWIKSVGPLYQPVAVQAKVRLALPGPRDLLGIMDLVLPEEVQDTKTSSKKKNQSDVDKDVQFTTYAALFRQLTGKLPKKIVIDNVIDTKTGKTSHQQLATTRDVSDFTPLANRINAFTKMTEAGIFTPAPVGAWWCSAKSCGYWRTCPFVNSERASASETNDE